MQKKKKNEIGKVEIHKLKMTKLIYYSIRTIMAITKQQIKYNTNIKLNYAYYNIKMK